MKRQTVEYQEKLKDPRWQKKRLEILERDDWTCQMCFDGESTLHVHHMTYFDDLDPWEIESKYLITYCESCHEKETGQYRLSKSRLIKALAGSQLSSNSINNLAEFFENNPQFFEPRFDGLLDVMKSFDGRPNFICCIEGCDKSVEMPHLIYGLCKKHKIKRIKVKTYA